MKAKKKGSGEKPKKPEKNNAVVDDNSTDSGWESCAFLHDLSIFLADIQEPSCSIDWNDSSPQTDIIAAAASHHPYLFDSDTTSHCPPDKPTFLCSAQFQPDMFVGSTALLSLPLPLETSISSVERDDDLY